MANPPTTDVLNGQLRKVATPTVTNVGANPSPKPAVPRPLQALSRTYIPTSRSAASTPKWA
jgi:hypothetical protein